MLPRMLKVDKTKDWKLPRGRFPSPDGAESPRIVTTEKYPAAMLAWL